MEYRSVEYQVVELSDGSGSKRSGGNLWKWSVRLSPHVSASGTEANRVVAIGAAEKKIDLALGRRLPT